MTPSLSIAEEFLNIEGMKGADWNMFKSEVSNCGIPKWSWESTEKSSSWMSMFVCVGGPGFSSTSPASMCALVMRAVVVLPLLFWIHFSEKNWNWNIRVVGLLTFLHIWSRMHWSDSAFSISFLHSCAASAVCFMSSLDDIFSPVVADDLSSCSFLCCWLLAVHCWTESLSLVDDSGSLLKLVW